VRNIDVAEDDMQRRIVRARDRVAEEVATRAGAEEQDRTAPASNDDTDEREAERSPRAVAARARRAPATGGEDMPDEAFVAAMRELLLERRKGLAEKVREGRAQEKREPLAEMVGGVADAGDESVAVERADLRNARIGRDVTELREIEGALARIEQGEYGYCIDCGGEIGEARLRVQPTAARDVRCQNLFEQLYIGPGAPPSL
jgi:RNA polymerase-binding transcription factor DksA